MKTLMDKINYFESLPAQTVEEFNKIFVAKLGDVPGGVEVEVGQIAGPDTCRWLTVGSLLVKHDFSRSPEVKDEERV